MSKSFPGAKALDQVSFDVMPGEVHALAGENGAGKSTLVKILAGMQPPDSGELVFKGRSVRLRSPHDALQIGISMIHQELMPFLDMTVAENVCMGREPTRSGWIDKAAMHRESAALLGRLGVAIPPVRKMRELSIAGMQTVEIAKALGYESQLIIMDEPTSAISEKEVDALLALIADLKARGVAIIYISHRMSEIFRIADTVTVLRDGRHVATEPAAQLDEARLIRLMVGRELGSVFPKTRAAKGAPALEVRHLTRRGEFEDISFTVHCGEVLGIAGLMGAGRTELVSAIFGLTKLDAGEIVVGGKPARLTGPNAAMRHGIALVTEDRKGYGLVPDMTVRENITLANLRRFSKGPFVSQAEETAAASERIRALAIKTSGPQQQVKYLSGGNQQKVVIAKALLGNPTVLILDEPTRGIDIGAKAEVYAIIARLAAEGKAILLVSSELPEVMSLSDRILIMREGRIAAGVLPGDTTPEEVLRHAMPL